MPVRVKVNCPGLAVSPDVVSEALLSVTLRLTVGLLVVLLDFFQEIAREASPVCSR